MQARSPVRSPTNVVLRRCTHTTFHSTETPQTSSQGFAQGHRWRCCYTFERPTTRLSFHSASRSTLQHTPCLSSFIPSLFGIVGHVRLTTTSTLGTTPASVGLFYLSPCVSACFLTIFLSSRHGFAGFDYVPAYINDSSSESGGICSCASSPYRFGHRITDFQLFFIRSPGGTSMPAGVTAPIMADRSTKRHKGDAPIGGPPGPDGYHGGYGQMPPQGRYQQPPYGGPSGPPMGPQSGYMGWQHGQYGNPPPPPPHSWGGHASPPPPGAMYPQRGGPPMTPDRAAYSGGYRGPPTAMQGPGGGRRTTKAPGSASRPSSKASEGPPGGAPDGPPSSGYQGGWSHPQGPPQGGQWPQHQWGGGPPPGWQGSGPGMHQSGPGYGTPGVYGGATSPARGGPGGRPRASPELYSGPPGVDMSDMDMCYMTSRSVGPPHDDDNGSIGGGANSSSKDKGRGSYKCGRVSPSPSCQCLAALMAY
jgi:hypothetical protein